LEELVEAFVKEVGEEVGEEVLVGVLDRAVEDVGASIMTDLVEELVVVEAMGAVLEVCLVEQEPLNGASVQGGAFWCKCGAGGCREVQGVCAHTHTHAHTHAHTPTYRIVMRSLIVSTGWCVLIDL